MARRGRYKLVARYLNYDNELYDLEADPTEENNLFGKAEFAETELELKRELERWFDMYSCDLTDGRKSVTLTGSGQRRLCWKDGAFSTNNKPYYQK